MQFYNFFKQISCFILLLNLVSCSSFGEKKTGDEIDMKNIDWATKTSFKLDFNDSGSYIEVLKPHEIEIVQYLLDGVEKGEIAAYNFFDKKQLSQQEIDYLFHPKDTVSVYDMELGREVMKPTVGELNRATIKKVRIEQEWYFSKKEFTMQTKVKAIAPMQTVFNPDGSERGDAPLFWVFLK